MIAIFGIYGALRCDEILKIEVTDIKKEGDVFLVNIPNTKTYEPKSFTIMPEATPWIKKYMALRPMNTTDKRFFLQYIDAKCTNRVI